MSGGTDSAFAGGNRAAITACAIVATLMQALDTTIANVALPYMQGSVSASQDQIDWVLTSYIVAAAIMTPPTGFLAGRFGLKNFFLASITGFTVASMLCGMAQSVTQIVLFRVLQGAFGAALVPLSQTVLLSTYPRERQGFAMALFGMGVMVGPVLGPVLGGWLTENYSWRWVFYINLPIGIIALLGMIAFLPETPRNSGEKLDWFGFGTLSLAIGALQIMLDRGEQKDWFSFRRNHDRSHRGGLGLLSVPGPHLHGRAAVRPAVVVPRSQLRRRRAVRFGHRPHLLFVDGAAAALSANAHGLSGGHRRHGHGTARHGHHGLDADRRAADRPHGYAPPARHRAWAHRLVVQRDDRLDAGRVASNHHQRRRGAGRGPRLSVRAAERRYALDAASANPHRRRRALQSVPQYRVERGHLDREQSDHRNTQANHAAIVPNVTAVNRGFEHPAIAHAWDPLTAAGRAALDAVITKQAQIIAYIDDYKFLMIATLAVLPLLIVFRKPAGAPPAEPIVVE